MRVSTCFGGKSISHSACACASPAQNGWWRVTLQDMGKPWVLNVEQKNLSIWHSQGGDLDAETQEPLGCWVDAEGWTQEELLLCELLWHPVALLPEADQEISSQEVPLAEEAAQEDRFAGPIEDSAPMDSETSAIWSDLSRLNSLSSLSSRALSSLSDASRNGA